MSEREKLLLCPFCGGLAQMETVQVHTFDISRYSVGCSSDGDDGECMGYQSMTTFARKTDAAKAWNKRAGGWQPIASAPKDGTSVLVSGPSFPAKHGPYISTGMYRDGMWFEREEMYPREWLNARTHWQPLPAPPED